MKCPESEQHLHRLMDEGGAYESPQWELHLATCTPCRDNALVARATLDALKRQPAPAPPAGLSKRIAERVAADRTPVTTASRGRARWWAAAAALAACVALVVLTQHLWMPSRTQSVRVESVPNRPDPAPSGVEDSVQKATTAVASLGGRLADNTKKHMQMLLSLAPKIDVADVEKLTPPKTEAGNTLEPAAASLRNGTSGFTHGVTVVAQTTRRAFSYFVRDLPSLTPSVERN